MRINFNAGEVSGPWCPRCGYKEGHAQDCIELAECAGMSRPVRDKDGKSWADKRDMIILDCFGVHRHSDSPRTGQDRAQGPVKSYPQARGKGGGLK